ncbi:MAG: response regulator transcription factor [Lachnospiraceae bacterium]|nr:response regulator transcription factor [Lachnospiraceae bacterium]
MQKIMIIEDEPSVQEELSSLLQSEGFQTFVAVDFKNIREQVREATPDLILLDMGLPGRDGLTLCAELRREVDIPIIFVTGRDGVGDELSALSLGGDDYITKPYHIPLLLAHIRAVLRRDSRAGKEIDTMKAAGLELNLFKGTVKACGNTAELTRNELQILVCLMSHAGEIVPRMDLIEALWEKQIYIDDNTLSVNMTRLRGKLAELGMSGCIKTRRGMGYQL